MNKLDSPTKLKINNSFLPQVTFPVYELSVSNACLLHSSSSESGSASFANFLRQMDTLMHPNDASFEERPIFQKSSSLDVCYILDSNQYPPTMKGYRSFLDKLKYQASQCGEKYTSSNTRRDSKGVITRYAICCSHSKSIDKRTKERHTNNSADDSTISVLKYKEETINNTRKHCVRGSKAMPRRCHTMYSAERCSLSTINIHVGKKCLFLIANENKNLMHTNHVRLLPGEAPTHFDKERKEELSIMAHSKSSGYCLQKGMIELHNGCITASKQTLTNMVQKERYKANSNSKILSGNTNNATSVLQVLEDFGCRVIFLKNISQFLPPPKKKLKYSNKNCSSDTTDEETVLNSNRQEEHGSESNIECFHSICVENESSEHISHEQIHNWIQTVAPQSTNNHAVCITWACKEQYLLAKAFCHAVHIDATHKICVVDNLLHLTMSVRDTNGKTYVIARMWIPNQTKWMFRYILLDSIPKLFGTDFCRKVRSFVSDGDPQLTSMIDLGLDTLYTTAKRIPCTWHLSNRPIRAAESQWHLKQGVSQLVKEWFCRFIEKWLCSFMIPGQGVESAEEYIISKSLLLGTVNSAIIKKCFTKDAVCAINVFLSQKIFTNEHTYLAYKNSKLFNMEQHSNSAHEGTNNAVKSMADPVTVRDSLVLATKKVSAYDRARFNERNLFVSRQFNAIKQFTHDFRHVTTHIAGVLSRQQRLSRHCISMLSLSDADDAPVFYVLHIMDHNSNSNTSKYSPTSRNNNKDESLNTGRVSKKEMSKMKTTTLQSKLCEEDNNLFDDERTLRQASFLHVRRVHFEVTDGSLRLYCSCHMDHRCGTICRHKFHIYERYLSHLGFHRFDHKSVHCINWTAYNFLANRDEQDMTTEQRNEWFKYKVEVDNGFTGTLCSHDMDNMTERIVGELLHSKVGDDVGSPHYRGHDLLYWYNAPATQRVLNFSVGFVQSCLKEYDGRAYDTVNMMSQVSNNPFEVDEDEHLIERSDNLTEFATVIAQQSPESLSVNEREKVFTKKMHEIKGMLNFHNVELFESVMEHLSRVQSNLALEQSVMYNQKNDVNTGGGNGEDLVEFPNRTYGRKNISKQH